jgi:hypothetical protein
VWPVYRLAVGARKCPPCACGLGFANLIRAEIAKRDDQAAEHDAGECIGLLKETDMPQNKPDAVSAEAGEQVPTRPHDSGSAANETVDGLDATTEELRHAAEDTPSGAGPGDIEKTPVFDRADLAPKI